MVEEMTLDEFEALLDEHGADLQRWPVKYRGAAARFADSDAGKFALAAECSLDELLKANYAIGPEAASDSNSDAFLERLVSIPSYHAHPAMQKQAGWWQWLLDGTIDLLSPAALASQAAVVVVILGMGMLVGMNSLQTGEEYSEYDLSDGWFAASLDLDLEDE